MYEFVTTKKCVRKVLEREITGAQDRVGCGKDKEICYRCRRMEEARQIEGPRLGPRGVRVQGQGGSGSLPG